MDNVLHFQQPTLTKNTFDLEFQDKKLLFDVGFQNEKIVFFWYKEDGELDGDGNPLSVFERVVELNKWDKFKSKLFGIDPQKALKRKALKSIRKAIDDFRHKMILQDSMTDLIMEIMDAGQINTSKTQ